MPVFPPEWLTRLRKVISSVLIPLARSPLVTALLEGKGPGSAGQWQGESLSPDDEQLLTLLLYWFWEYVEQRLSPSELLGVLSHLLASKITED